MSAPKDWRDELVEAVCEYYKARGIAYPECFREAVDPLTITLHGGEVRPKDPYSPLTDDQIAFSVKISYTIGYAGQYRPR